jgi:hypothetical protein
MGKGSTAGRIHHRSLLPGLHAGAHKDSGVTLAVNEPMLAQTAACVDRHRCLILRFEI